MPAIQIDELTIRLPSDTHNTFNPTYAFGGRSVHGNHHGGVAVGLRDAQSGHLLLPIDAEGNVVVTPGRRYHVVSVFMDTASTPTVVSTPAQAVSRSTAARESEKMDSAPAAEAAGGSAAAGAPSPPPTERAPRRERKERQRRERGPPAGAAEATTPVKTHTQAAEPTAEGADSGEAPFSLSALAAEGAGGQAVITTQPAARKERKERKEASRAPAPVAQEGAEEETYLQRFALMATPGASQMPEGAAVPATGEAHAASSKPGKRASKPKASSSPVTSTGVSPAIAASGLPAREPAREPAATRAGHGPVQSSPSHVPATLPPAANGSGAKRPRPPLASSSSDSD